MGSGGGESGVDGGGGVGSEGGAGVGDDTGGEGGGERGGGGEVWGAVRRWTLHGGESGGGPGEGEVTVHAVGVARPRRVPPVRDAATSIVRGGNPCVWLPKRRVGVVEAGQRAAGGNQAR